MKRSSTEFSAWLRSEGVRLANGEIDEIFFSDFQLDQAITESDRGKVTPTYMRTVLNRVGEIKAAGRVKISRTDGADRPIGFAITINRDFRQKVLTESDIPAIEARVRNKFLKRIMGFMPNVTDLEGEQLKGAMVGIQRYQDMIKQMAEAE